MVVFLSPSPRGRGTPEISNNFQFLKHTPLSSCQNRRVSLMGKNKKRSPKKKLEIVLEGLQSDNIAETCRKHGIYANQFYQWKEKLEDAASDVFSNGKKDREKEKLKRENKRLEETIVELSCENQTLKKKDS